jgi:hypothetical protein
VVTKAVYKNGALRISGEHFVAGAVVEINGVTPAPQVIFKPATGKLVVKGTRRALGISAEPGTNSVTVAVDGVESLPFVF